MLLCISRELTMKYLFESRKQKDECPELGGIWYAKRIDMLPWRTLAPLHEERAFVGSF